MLHDLIAVKPAGVLNNLDAMLDKAAAYAESKGFEFTVLLNSRLAPDQFHLTRQIQIACDTSKLSAARLCGKEKEAPVHEDNEATLEQLRTRIASVVDYLGNFNPVDFAGAEERNISLPRWKEKYLTGYEFAINYAIPNFYFHIATAYAILRHNGVDLGKRDYLGTLPFKK